MRYQMTEQALNRVGEMWVKIMKQKIKEKGKVASGFLLNSIDYRVIRDDSGPILEIQYADYWKYVNDGRKARGDDRPISADNGAVPIPALLKWIKIKGLRGRNKKGRFTTNLSLAFAIRAKIWKFGIKPANFFDASIETLESMLDPAQIPAGVPAELRQELQNIFISAAEDINVIIENMIDKEISKPSR